MAPPEKLLPFMNKPTTTQQQKKDGTGTNDGTKLSIDFINHFKIPNKALGLGSASTQLHTSTTENCRNAENNNDDDIEGRSFPEQMLTETLNVCNPTTAEEASGNSSAKVNDEELSSLPAASVASAATDEKKRKASFLPFTPVRPRPATAGPFTCKPTPFGINKNMNSIAVTTPINNMKRPAPYSKPSRNCQNNKQVDKGTAHQDIGDKRNASSCINLPPAGSNSMPSTISLKKPIANSSIQLSDYNSNDTLAEELRGKQGDFLEIPQLLRTCRQRAPIPIDLAVKELENIKKLGEGVYGEVFMADRIGSKDPSVFKIIPYGGKKKVNGEIQKSADDIEAEVIISRELNRLRDGCRGTFCSGLAYLKEAHITQGKYPKVLIEKWKDWHAENKSENDCPEFDHKQKYVILEYAYAGRDVESFVFDNSKQAYSLLIQVIHCLAAGEAALAFEHRDLHWGNILVNELEDKNEPILFTLTGNTIQIPSCGIKANLIDYTISRLTNYDGRPIYTDLSNDEDQFNGSASEDYQFEIYRMMRRENSNAWHTFCPKSNIYWCHYLAGKLLKRAYFKEQESATHMRYLCEMKSFEKSILSYTSCFDFCVSYYSELMDMKKRLPSRYKY